MGPVVIIKICFFLNWDGKIAKFFNQITDQKHNPNPFSLQKSRMRPELAFLQLCGVKKLNISETLRICFSVNENNKVHKIKSLF